MTGDMSTRIYITGIYQQTDISELEQFWQMVDSQVSTKSNAETHPSSVF